MKLKITGLLLAIIFTISIGSFAQTDRQIRDNSPLLDRVYFGGNVGFQFGNITNIQIAPIVGYRVTDKLSAGVGIQYQYTNYKIFGLSTNNYGGLIFARYRIKSPLFLQAEYEYLNYEVLRTRIENERASLLSFFVGGGIAQPINDNAAFTLLVLYNLSYDANDPNSPYSTPLKISGGINLGF